MHKYGPFESVRGESIPSVKYDLIPRQKGS